MIIVIVSRMTFLFTYLIASTIAWFAKLIMIVTIIRSVSTIIQTITDSFISEATRRWVGISRILPKYAWRGSTKNLRNNTLLWMIWAMRISMIGITEWLIILLGDQSMMWEVSWWWSCTSTDTFKFLFMNKKSSTKLYERNWSMLISNALSKWLILKSIKKATKSPLYQFTVWYWLLDGSKLISNTFDFSEVSFNREVIFVGAKKNIMQDISTR